MSLMAVPGLNSDTAGLIVFWRLSGSTPYYTFTNAWCAAGLFASWAPPSVTPEVAAGRAAKTMKRPGRLVYRAKLPQGGEGWKIAMDASDDDVNITHRIECRVALSKDGNLSVAPSWHSWADEIKEQFNSAVGELTSNDISVWLANLVEKHDAVSLRDTGGFYFVPPHQVANWRRAAAVVNENTSHRCYEIPAVRTEEALEAVADAIANEAGVFASKTAEELGNLGLRGLENRRHSISSMLNKVGRYEELMGRKLDALRSRLEAVQAEAAANELKIQALEDDERASQ